MSYVHSQRSSAAITIAVWKALFLREALGRLFSGRAAWFWLLFEPIFHVSYLVLIFTVVRVRTIGGIDTALWVVVGMLGFFMFRRTGTQVMNAIEANQALFSYRQVKPVDTVLVRGILEGLLMVVVTGILLTGIALSGRSVVPVDPIPVLGAFFELWLLGIGFGLVISAAREVVPELGRVAKLAMLPMYFLSGVMFPLSGIPQPYRDWLLLNPVAHGLELARLGFAPHYHAVQELSIGYLSGFALATTFLGLALHRRFALRIATQ